LRGRHHHALGLQVALEHRVEHQEALDVVDQVLRRVGPDALPHVLDHDRLAFDGREHGARAFVARLGAARGILSRVGGGVGQIGFDQVEVAVDHRVVVERLQHELAQRVGEDRVVGLDLDLAFLDRLGRLGRVAIARRLVVGRQIGETLVDLALAPVDVALLGVVDEHLAAELEHDLGRQLGPVVGVVGNEQVVELQHVLLVLHVQLERQERASDLGAEVERRVAQHEVGLVALETLLVEVVGDLELLQARLGLGPQRLVGVGAQVLGLRLAGGLAARDFGFLELDVLVLLAPRHLLVDDDRELEHVDRRVTDLRPSQAEAQAALDLVVGDLLAVDHDRLAEDARFELGRLGVVGLALGVLSGERDRRRAVRQRQREDTRGE